MRPHTLAAFETPPSAPAWADHGFDGRRAYMRTLDYQCNPISLQDLWLAKSATRWDVVDMDTGHMPFVSQPEALAVHIVRCFTSFAQL
ncbi:hypothetical protein VTH82DRAFT_1747 [Thermothelomyces myriococcoides]